jgi:nicotinamide riboside kinase
MVAGDDASDLTLPARGLVCGPFDPADPRDAFLQAFAEEACGHLTVHATEQDGRGPANLIGFDVVFGYGSAAEAPGRILAAGIGARYVPVTAPGRLEAVAAGRSRRPSCPRESVPRICLFGPESTGKSTLGLALAEHFGTVMAPEYGRLYTETFGQECGAEDLRRIVIGHRAGTRAAGRWANAVLIEDTDPVLTAIWSDVLTGQRDPWFEGYRDTADLYLLTGIDVPWVADDVRYFPAEAARRDFHDRCRAELVRRALDFVEVTGDPATRLATALEAIRERFPDIAA